MRGARQRVGCFHAWGTSMRCTHLCVELVDARGAFVRTSMGVHMRVCERVRSCASQISPAVWGGTSLHVGPGRSAFMHGCGMGRNGHEGLEQGAHPCVGRVHVRACAQAWVIRRCIT